MTFHTVSGNNGKSLLNFAVCPGNGACVMIRPSIFCPASLKIFMAKKISIFTMEKYPARLAAFYSTWNPKAEA